ncbi:MAG: CRTAC1 family protein [Myxococcales bacterium]|nr:CRTAC1 family protein [Myxococcales bacterium]
MRTSTCAALILLVACHSDPACDDVCGVDSACSSLECRCGGPEGPVCAEGEVCEGGACVLPLPEPVCTAGSAYAPGSPHFVEVTDAWGLRGVEGVRLNVVDLDGDGAADLVVRRGGQGPDGVDGVRRTWVLRNVGGRFEDVTEASGLLARRDGRPGRPIEVLAFGDVDGDGDLDAYVGVSTAAAESADGERGAILLNDGAGRFTYGPESDVSATDILHIPAGASFVDVDRDGLLDLFVPQHNFTGAGGGTVFAGDRLYRGDGTGAFTEITDEAGLATAAWSRFDDLNEGRAHSRAWASLARDLDGDGLPELLVASYGRAPNHLWRGRDDGGSIRFDNDSVASGYAFDEDQSWTDNEFAKCFCQSNREAEGCAELGAPRVSCAPNWSHDQDRQPFRLGGNSAQTSAGDVDNDGDLDLLTSEIRHWWAGMGSDAGELLVNDGAGRFARPGNATTGLAVDHLGRSDWDEGHMTNALFDFDNDGRLDVYIGGSDYPGNRGHLFHNEGGLRFAGVPTADFFEHNRSHGVVVADFDRDGDLDVIVGHSRARCNASLPHDCYETSNVRAFENVTPAGNWVQLHLVGAHGANPSAIGAQVLVRYGALEQLLEVDGGGGHYGAQQDLVLHVGLGPACEAEVIVRWPDAALTTETHVLPAGHRFELTPGERPRWLRAE